MTAGDPPSKPSTAPEAAVDKTKPSSSSVPQPAAPAAAPGPDGPKPTLVPRLHGQPHQRIGTGLFGDTSTLYKQIGEVIDPILTHL